MGEQEADSSTGPWWTIRSISIHGDIALAQVENDWAGMRFDDIRTMLKQGGSWRITAKAYRLQP